MTCTIRCGVLAIAAWLVLFVPADARAQPEQRPSTILPLELRWTKVLSAAPAAAPVHEDGRVFVARRDGQIAAVSLLDGEQGGEGSGRLVPVIGRHGVILHHWVR